MRYLSPQEYYQKALPSLQKIFKSVNPYDEPFEANVEAKLVLSDYWYEMDEDLLEAVTAFCTNHQEAGFYISIYNKYQGEGFEYRENDHWYISLNDLASYQAVTKFFIPPIWNVVYSEKGLWGILGSDEHFGLIGGSGDFIQEIRSHIQGVEEQVHEFLEEWEFNKKHFSSNTGWILKLLTNVYDQSTAKSLLEMHQL